jgi:hypothetical protein
MRLTLKVVNNALRDLGEGIQLSKADGYFYFASGEAAKWIDTTVRVPTLSSLTLEQWIDEFKRLKKLNEEFLSGKVQATVPNESTTTVPRRKRKK